MDRVPARLAGADADALGRAVFDYQREDAELGTLTYRNGTDASDGRVREFYFAPPAEWPAVVRSALERLGSDLDGDGNARVLDVGCGAGQHALWLTDRGVDVVGLDASPYSVAAARLRGLERVVAGDMFRLPVETGRFRAVLCLGTQLGLAGSLAGVSDLLGEFARVTAPAGDGADPALAVVDGYDPRALEADADLLGYRPDLREGIAHRCFHLEYEPAVAGPSAGNGAEDGNGDAGRERIVGPSLHFLLYSPARLREAAIGTPWTVTDVFRSGGAYYVAALTASP